MSYSRFDSYDDIIDSDEFTYDDVVNTINALYEDDEDYESELGALKGLLSEIKGYECETFMTYEEALKTARYDCEEDLSSIPVWLYAYLDEDQAIQDKVDSEYSTLTIDNRTFYFK